MTLARTATARRQITSNAIQSRGRNRSSGDSASRRPAAENLIRHPLEDGFWDVPAGSSRTKRNPGSRDPFVHRLTLPDQAARSSSAEASVQLAARKLTDVRVAHRIGLEVAGLPSRVRFRSFGIAERARTGKGWSCMGRARCRSCRFRSPDPWGRRPKSPPRHENRSFRNRPISPCPRLGTPEGMWRRANEGGELPCDAPPGKTDAEP